eukprot:gnl/MRDRNA2_/MRDRNA2_115252_c0_seq1.p1 gnl/MRDRNA2_/MRDRNA2_115252_c0~~gnl/MRDRNA2_/MRDRNA2_115252_c0_seq1.p1  ORF type:complete len:617 (+),score=105.43 gnl/MRDRNA2_/MRDRNA2_115252_c0_seq1:108-1958(+)
MALSGSVSTVDDGLSEQKRSAFANDLLESEQASAPSDGSFEEIKPSYEDKQPIYQALCHAVYQRAQAVARKNLHVELSKEAKGSSVVMEDDVLAAARSVLRDRGLDPASHERELRAMSSAALRYWKAEFIPVGNQNKAVTNIAQFLHHSRKLFWHREPWRGVNLGGWLLLEPGPNASLFQEHGASSATCEWSFMRMLNANHSKGGASASDTLRKHRDTFVTEDDFKQIRNSGLNAVRIPFGYWTVTGPSQGDIYEGPALEFLDRAITWAEKYGLQVVLDLHGAPGGESGDKPCGHVNRSWKPSSWRTEESLEVLRILCTRFRNAECVSGIQVCNEPCETVPVEDLCRFYDQAVAVVRESGMAPDRVAVVLPVYRVQRLEEIWWTWHHAHNGFLRHPNVAFDLHLYHCFGGWWHKLSLEQQIQMCRKHQKLLRRIPSVVGEWSLALGRAAANAEGTALPSFAKAQLDAYSYASHGWFFWNWKDSPQCDVWDFTKCMQNAWVSSNQWVGAPPSPSGSEKSEASFDSEKKRRREPSPETAEKRQCRNANVEEPLSEVDPYSAEMLNSQLIAMGFSSEMVNTALMNCAALPPSEKFDVTLDLLTSAAVEPVASPHIITVP